MTPLTAIPLPRQTSLRRLILHAAEHPKTVVTTPKGTAITRSNGAPVSTHQTPMMPNTRLVTANPLRRFFMPSSSASANAQRRNQLYTS
jgi:hypothetical protein